MLPLPPNHSQKCELLYKASSTHVMFPESVFLVSALGYSSAPSLCVRQISISLKKKKLTEVQKGFRSVWPVITWFHSCRL